MSNKKLNHILFSLVVQLPLMAALAACSLSLSGSSERSLLSYLDLPPTTPTPASLPVTAASTPIPETQTSPSKIAFAAEASRYRHPLGLFDFSPPAGWTLTAEDDALAEFTGPNRDMVIRVSMTNTGEALDAASFQRLVEAREANFFGVYERYRQIDRRFDQNGTGVLVVKRLIFNGREQQVASLYTQSDRAVLTADLWLAPNRYDAYLGFFESFFAQIHVDPLKISSQPVYPWTYAFRTEDGQIALDVPLHWTVESARQDKAEVNRFVAPDGEAAIQLIRYDDGARLSPTDAGFITMELLKQTFGKHLSFSNDQVLAGGGERLTWNAKDGALSGVTFFKSDNTTLVILTMSYPTAKENVYLNLYNVVAASYWQESIQ